MKLTIIAGLTALSLAFALSACSTAPVRISKDYNPAPSKRFSHFEHFELQPVTLAPGVERNAENKHARDQLQAHLARGLGTLLASWNNPTKQGSDGHTLSVRPQIEDIHYVSDYARMFGGSWAGSSRVVLRVRYVDTKNGDVVAQPEFVQRAAASNGKRGVGTNNGFMLQGAADLVTRYTRMNYKKSVGGPTGKNERASATGDAQ